MNFYIIFTAAATLLCAQTPVQPGKLAKVANVQAPPAAPKPAPKVESLHYNVNWPSGLTLGEADVTSTSTESGLSFSFKLDASIPGFAVSESAKSRATPEFCSTELQKEGLRGKRKVDEKTEFDVSKMTATRATANGGKSEISTSQCAKDALTFVQFLRRELALGRLPAQQKVYYGAGYSVRVQFIGTQRVTIAGDAAEADKLTATVKGPTSEMTADLFFAKDQARTPLLIQVPLAMGKFSMELVR